MTEGSATIMRASSQPGRPQVGTIEQTGKRQFIILLWTLLVFSGLAYTALSVSKPKFARSEIAYAEISREMILKNDYITSYYHYMPTIDKPAMMYWLIIPQFKMFGQTAVVTRIPSLIAALATLTILAFAIRRAFGWQTALFASMILATTSRFMEFASLCMTDVCLTLFDLITMLSLYAVTRSKHRTWWFLLAGVSSGLAVLTKGPVGFVLPAICFGMYLAITKQLKVILKLDTLLAIAAFIAVAAPWYIAVAFQVAGPQAFLSWLWHYNIERFAGEAYAYHFPWYYMIESFLLGFAPWAVLIPCAVLSSIDKWKKREQPEQSKIELYMWLWVGLTTLFFSLSKGKMNYYDLPAFPAAAALMAIHLKRWLDADAKTAKVLGWIFATALLVVGIVSCVIVPHITGGALQNWFMIPAALFGGCAFLVLALLKHRLTKAYAVIGAAILLTVTGFGVEVMPAIAAQIPALDYLRQLSLEHKPYTLAMHQDFAITVDWIDHGLFYTGKVPELITDAPAMTRFLDKAELAYAIMPKNRFDELPQATRDHCTILGERPYISDKLALPFILKRHGNLCGDVPLVLVSNQTSKP